MFTTHFKVFSKPNQANFSSKKKQTTIVVLLVAEKLREETSYELKSTSLQYFHFITTNNHNSFKNSWVRTVIDRYQELNWACSRIQKQDQIEQPLPIPATPVSVLKSSTISKFRYQINILRLKQIL